MCGDVVNFKYELPHTKNSTVIKISITSEIKKI